MNKFILLCLFITMGQNNKTQTIRVCRKQLKRFVYFSGNVQQYTNFYEHGKILFSSKHFISL